MSLIRRSGRPPRCSGTALAVTVALLGGTLLPLAGPAPVEAARPEGGFAGDPDALVACGDGPAFPVAALGGPQGAEMAPDAAARRLSRAATTGEAGYVPRGGWIRVVDAPDRAVFVTPLHLPRSVGGPLLQVTVSTASPGTTDPAAWEIASAGFCWPRSVPDPGVVSVPWTLADPVDAEGHEVAIVPDGMTCDLALLPDPVVLLLPEHVAITLRVPADGAVCEPGGPTPLAVLLPEPLHGRALVDGSTEPPSLRQDGVPLVEPGVLLDPGSIRVEASAVPTAVAGSHAIADALGSLPQLVPVTVVDTLDLRVRLTSAQDLLLAGPPRLCLVGPDSAPDDAGLIDRCWGDPDPGAALAPHLSSTAGMWPELRAGEAVELRASIARGDVRCDYPPGRWHLEVVLTPLDDGHGWTDVALPEVPLTVDATGMVPARELGRLESRYCGMAYRPVVEASSAP